MLIILFILGFVVWAVHHNAVMKRAVSERCLEAGGVPVQMARGGYKSLKCSAPNTVLDIE